MNRGKYEFWVRNPRKSSRWNYVPARWLREAEVQVFDGFVDLVRTFVADRDAGDCGWQLDLSRGHNAE